MNRKKYIGIFALFIIVLNVFIIFRVHEPATDPVTVTMNAKVGVPTKFQAYYLFDKKADFGETQSVYQVYDGDRVNKESEISLELPQNVCGIRLDLGENKTDIELSDIEIGYRGNSVEIDKEILKSCQTSMLKNIKYSEDKITMKSTGNDPYINIDMNKVNLVKLINDTNREKNIKTKVLLCVFLDLVALFILLCCKHTFRFIKDIIINRKLVMNLAKNDFRTKYSGSYFGIIWAFVQPVVTVMIYVFVFQIAFKAAPLENDFPYVLWLIAGLVPWFMFGDGIMTSTNCLLEYSYLVKKVVFQISILPVVKIISALFVHLFFIGLSIVIFWINGYHPTVYYLQIVYYLICNICIVLAISYLTASIQPFFKDFSQIVNIIIQVGMWMTPIMYQTSMLPNEYLWIMKLNPMYYVVEGYRDSLISRAWFWEKPVTSFYFWILTAFIMFAGFKMFRKLKVHFSDVL